MATAECESIILEDTNGGILKPKPGKKTHLITFEPSLDFLAELSQIVTQSLRPEDIPTRFREVLSLIYPRSSFFYPVKYQFRPELAKWHPLKSDYSVGVGEQLAHLMFRHYTEFFDTYVFSEQEKNGLISARNLGAQIVLNTGIEYGAKAEYKQVANFVRDVLHPDFAVIMTPDGRIMSGVHTKMASTALIGKASLVRADNGDFYQDPNRYLSLGKGVDIYPRDDDYGVLCWLSSQFGIKTYCTLPLEEASKQPHLKQVGTPEITEEMLRSGKIPVSDPDMSIMLHDIADPYFHNHPIIRVSQQWQPQFRPTSYAS